MILFFLVCASAGAQAPQQSNVAACDPADAEHCKATTIEGRPMRELLHEGTRVAVGEPVVTAGGDYRVFVQVNQVGPGKAEVRPKDFFALNADASHTRFSFYDKLGEIEERQAQRDALSRGVAGADQAQDAGSQPSSGPVSSSGMIHPPPLENTKKPDPGFTEVMSDGSGAQDGSRPGTALKPEDIYLGRKTLREGGTAEGFVYFRKPKRSKLQVGAQDTLYEIDIPVNGIIFRFNQNAQGSRPGS